MVSLKRKELFLVPAGESLRDVLELIGQRIRVHPTEGCYFIANAELLFFIELTACNKTGALGTCLGVTERRFVRLLCGSQVAANERWQILSSRCGLLDPPSAALRLFRRTSSAVDKFAKSIMSDAAAAFPDIDTLRKIHHRLIDAPLPFGMMGPNCEFRRALYAAIVANLLGAPSRELITHAMLSRDTDQLAHAATVEQRLLDSSVGVP